MLNFQITGSIEWSGNKTDIAVVALDGATGFYGNAMGLDFASEISL